MKILIVDDHLILRKGLIQILKKKFSSSEFFEADNGIKALKIIQSESMDLILLDISMPGMDGIDVLKQISAFNVDSPVIILSMQPEEQYALRVLKAGAKGYISKDAKAETVLAAVERVLSGKRYISEKVGDILADSVDNNKDGELFNLLSDREMQVLHLLGRGYAVSEIGKELNLSVNTISTYRSRITDKLGLKNNASLIKYAIDNNLV